MTATTAAERNAAAQADGWSELLQQARTGTQPLQWLIDAAHAALSGSCEALKSLISQQLEKTIQLSIQIADVDLSASPAQSMARENAQMAQNFSATISENPLVKSLIREFEAKIIPGSIKFNRSIN